MFAPSLRTYLCVLLPFTILWKIPYRLVGVCGGVKVERHGKARTLNQTELDVLFNQGFKTVRDRALFGVALFTAGRIQEVCSLFCSDAYTRHGEVRSHLTFRKASTKGKLATRTIPISPDLRILLGDYSPEISGGYLFPGLNTQQHIHVDSAARVLKKASRRVGIEGVSTHSFRRTALTQMSNAGIPLRVIQEISGHRDLAQLQKYLEVTDQQVLGAIASLSIISPVGVGQPQLLDFEERRSRNFGRWRDRPSRLDVLSKVNVFCRCGRFDERLHFFVGSVWVAFAPNIH